MTARENPYQPPEQHDRPRPPKWWKPKPSPYRYVIYLGVLAAGAAVLAFHLLTQYQVYQLHLHR